MQEQRPKIGRKKTHKTIGVGTATEKALIAPGQLKPYRLKIVNTCQMDVS